MKIRGKIVISSQFLIILIFLLICGLSCSMPMGNKSADGGSSGVKTRGTVPDVTTSGKLVNGFNVGSGFTVKYMPNKVNTLSANYMFSVTRGHSTDDTIFIAGMQTCNGNDTCNLRFKEYSQGNNTYLYKVKVEEEKSKDSETTHSSAEIVAGIEVEMGRITDHSGHIIGEAGRTEIRYNDDKTEEENWYTITLSRNYDDPVVFAHVITLDSGHECHSRIRNVTSNSFQLRLEEWLYRDQRHTTEFVNYIVLEEGVHLLEPYSISGTRFDNYYLEVRKKQLYDEGPETCAFSTDFTGGPPYTIVLTDLQTSVGGDPVVTRVSDIDFGNRVSVGTVGYLDTFQVKLQEEEKLTDGHPADEMLGYLAIGPKTGPKSTVVDNNGWLQVSDNQLCNKNGSPIQLRGMSAFWTNWEDGRKFANPAVIDWLVEEWDIDVFRIPIGVDPREPEMKTGELIDNSGYMHHKQEQKGMLLDLINYCINKGIYVIVDWHIHIAVGEDVNGNELPDYKAECIALFSDIADTYKYRPNVIFEIWNEPSKPGHIDMKDIEKGIENSPFSWSTIKEDYCEDVIAAIRAKSDHIIIVPTPCWDQWPEQANANPIDEENLVYCFHFYAGSHVMHKYSSEIGTNYTPYAAILYKTTGKDYPNTYEGFYQATIDAAPHIDSDFYQTPRPLDTPWDDFFNRPKLAWQWNFDPHMRLMQVLNDSERQIALFVSEWGATTYDGGQPATSSHYYPDASEKWLYLLRTYKISWCNWSISDKNEGASMLLPGAYPYGGWDDAELSLSGRFMKRVFTGGVF
jgi:aryl-phospho-beta-D-glucosidase BglC (GH1 family)